MSFSAEREFLDANILPPCGFGDRVHGVLVSEASPDPLGRVALFAWRLPVQFEDAVDGWLEGAKLGSFALGSSAIPGGSRC